EIGSIVTSRRGRPTSCGWRIFLTSRAGPAWSTWPFVIDAHARCREHMMASVGAEVDQKHVDRGPGDRNSSYLLSAADTGMIVSNRSHLDGSDGKSMINPGAITSMTARVCSHCLQDTGKGPMKRNTPPPGSMMVNSRSKLMSSTCALLFWKESNTVCEFRVGGARESYPGHAGLMPDTSFCCLVVTYWSSG